MLIKIAFQGERGSFAEDAIFKFFDEKEIEIIACPTLESLREKLENGNAELAVLPIKNSLAGEVENVKKLLENVDWKKLSECELQIRQNLIGCRDASLETLRTVESHKVALAQCENFFIENPHLQKIESPNTAFSAKRAIESGDITRAAIANARTAEIYGGRIISANIQDSDENYTTFHLFTLKVKHAF
ncbi:MAG: hypothetical protein H7Z37_08775 [Pyrinomonadaceae bacterium]|nr:hypothetical protein [Pyrinomonadaceae bacterium]